MKLRNKKTGEIVDTLCSDDITKGISFGIDHHDGNPTMTYYNSLAELNAEWEDYEEDKIYWYIDSEGEIMSKSMAWFTQEQIVVGNIFETEEEAEKALEKLKAWKRLKDKGFRFEGYDNSKINYVINDDYLDRGVDMEFLQDFAFLFGGVE